MSEEQKQIKHPEVMTLTTETLKTLFEEFRKPIVTEQEKKQLENSLAERKANAETQKEIARQKKINQSICTHEHMNGASHCVYIENGNFILCQKCQDVIRPDRAEFNRLFQGCQPEMFG